MAGRPRSFDRDLAVDTALDAFWRGGFDATSVAELTARMGIGPPSLYAAFGDKQRLFEEAAARYVEAFRAGVDAALDGPDAAASVRGLLVESARVQTEPGTPPGCLVLSEPRLRPERDRLERTVAARIAADRPVADSVPAERPDAADVARYVVAVLVGMSALAREGASRADLVAVAEVAGRVL